MVYNEIMPTITMRELKQNPQSAVQQVLAANQPFTVTSRGHDTGVVMQPARPTGPQPFVTGAVLNAIADLSPLTPEAAQAWKDDIENGMEYDLVADHWERS